MALGAKQKAASWPPCGLILSNRLILFGEFAVHHVAAVGAVLDSADGTASNLLRVVATADSPSQIFDLAAGLGEPGAFSTRPADPIRRNYA